MKVVITLKISVAKVNTEPSLPKRLESEKQFDSVYKALKPLFGPIALYLLKAIIEMMFGS